MTTKYTLQNVIKDLSVRLCKPLLEGLSTHLRQLMRERVRGWPGVGGFGGRLWPDKWTTWLAEEGIAEVQSLLLGGIVRQVVALERPDAAGGSWPIMTLKEEDWRRVLTTSKGQVAMAPIVPPHLQQNGWQSVSRGTGEAC